VQPIAGESIDMFVERTVARWLGRLDELA